MRSPETTISRRQFLWTTSAAVAGVASGAVPPISDIPIVDIHQHCGFVGRTNEELLLHQRNTGVRTTVIMPGPNPKEAGGNEPVRALARAHADGYAYFACGELTQAGAAREIERYLKTGAIGIGELKSRVPCDGPAMERVAEVAREYGVPVLLHFEDGNFNDGYERFYRILDKYPTVTFIGHATSFWGAIDKNYSAARGPYPRGPVTPGGLSDLWLARYPNYYGDLSSNSGNGGLSRDPEFARGFLQRHRDKLVYGTDCSCRTGTGPHCIAVVKLGLLRELTDSPEMLHQLLYRNARKLYRFTPAQIA